MRKQVIAEKGAPPKGIYSPAIMASGTLVFVSGQGPVDQTGEFQFGSFEEQARLTFQNVTTLLQAAGTSWEHVVKVGVFFTVQAVLPPNMAIEVDCIAVIPEE
jgi:2-iminobutanoate/2-iminopropanoate deaminase